jgi:chromosome segregation protein
MRRLHREGASDYFINGKPSRLKDIQRLFMDTGIGRMSYSFMVQGQIDQVLSANPAERRYLFEEAAGVTRYKVQRREALNKARRRRRQPRAHHRRRQRGRPPDRHAAPPGRQGPALPSSPPPLHAPRPRVAGQAARRPPRPGRHLEADFAACREQVAVLGDDLRVREAALGDARARRTALAEQVQQSQQSLFEQRTARENAEGEARTSDLRADDLVARLAEIAREAGDAEAAIADYDVAPERQTLHRPDRRRRLGVGHRRRVPRQDRRGRGLPPPG